MGIYFHKWVISSIVHVCEGAVHKKNALHLQVLSLECTLSNVSLFENCHIHVVSRNAKGEGKSNMHFHTSLTI